MPHQHNRKAKSTSKRRLDRHTYPHTNKNKREREREITKFSQCGPRVWCIVLLASCVSSSSSLYHRTLNNKSSKFPIYMIMHNEMNMKGVVIRKNSYVKRFTYNQRVGLKVDATSNEPCAC